MKIVPKSVAVKSFLTLLLTVSLTVLLFACRETASSESDGVTRSWADEEAKKVVAAIRREHPRIYLTPERIPALKAQALTSKVGPWKQMHQRMGGKQAALFYAMEIGPELGAKMSRNDYGRMAAKALMDAISGGGKASPDDLAILYDWAHDALTQEEKRAFVDFCKKRIGKEIRIHNEKAHGYRTSPKPEGMIAALAFYRDGIDDRYAEQLLLKGIRDTLQDNLAMEQVAGKDGGFADGTYYLFQLGGPPFNSFLALTTATGSSFFFDHAVFSRLPNQLIQALLPFAIERAKTGKASRYFATFHDNWTSTTSDYGSVGSGMATNMAITAAEFRRKGDEKTASLYMWLVKEAFGGIPYQAENPVSFVLLDETIPSLGPKEVGLPLAEALGWDEKAGEIDRDRFGKKAGIGWVAMRSAWNDPNATYALFKAEPFYYHGHMHHDSLAFMIAKGEELALARSGNYMCWYEGGPLRDKNPGWPQAANFFTRTISTNNLLVFDPKED
ncbi:partial Heparin and heparin-sulfate lyase, partial [Anaerolineales bacterium]